MPASFFFRSCAHFTARLRNNVLFVSCFGRVRPCRHVFDLFKYLYCRLLILLLRMSTDTSVLCSFRQTPAFFALAFLHARRHVLIVSRDPLRTTGASNFLEPSPQNPYSRPQYCYWFRTREERITAQPNRVFVFVRQVYLHRHSHTHAYG